MEGWIKAHRSMLNHWVWKDSEYLKGWLYILFRANFSEANTLIDKAFITVNRGQFVTSLKSLSNDTGMSIQRIRTFLKLLETDQMVKVETTSKLTKITVCNYDNYQDLQHSANTVPTQCQHSANTVPTTDKKNKELKERKELKEEDTLCDKPPKKTKKFIKPTVDELRAYCLEEEISVDVSRFFYYYESNGWKVGRNQMKDWKAALRTWGRNQVQNTKTNTNGQQPIATGSGKDWKAGTERYIKP